MMALDRRSFLRATGLAAGAVFLGDGLGVALARAAGTVDPNRKFVFVYFAGGWDILLSLDPRDPATDGYGTDAAGDDARFEADRVRLGWTLIDQGGATNFSPEVVKPGYDSPMVFGPSVSALPGGYNSFARHADVACLVRGISMDTVTHEVGRRYFVTGMMPRGLSATGSSMGTRIVAQQGDLSPIPNLVCRNEAYNDGLPAWSSPLSVGSAEDLYATLKDGPQAPDEVVRRHLDAFRASGAGRCDPAGLNRFSFLDEITASQIKARELVNGTDAVPGEMADLFDFRRPEHADLRFRYLMDVAPAAARPGGERMAVALQALRYGVSQSVSLTVNDQGMDTHDDNWVEEHHELQQLAWARVEALIQDLKTTPDSKAGGMLIDHTTVVCFSEFSRTAAINVRNGRDHSLTNSCVMLGAGVPHNTVIGASSQRGMNPLPIDPVTGVALEAGGTTLTPNNIMASLMTSAGMGTDKLRTDGVPVLIA
jgi:hypothetical protein